MSNKTFPSYQFGCHTQRKVVERKTERERERENTISGTSGNTVKYQQNSFTFKQIKVNPIMNIIDFTTTILFFVCKICLEHTQFLLHRLLSFVSPKKREGKIKIKGKTSEKNFKKFLLLLKYEISLI